MQAIYITLHYALQHTSRMQTAESYLINSQLTYITDLVHSVAMVILSHQYSFGVNLACIVDFHIKAETVECQLA